MFDLKVDILWEGPVFDPSGYGAAARGYVIPMMHHSDNVFVRPINYYTGKVSEFISDRDKTLLKTHAVYGDDVSFVHVEHKTPGELTKTRYYRNIGYTVWETDTIPDYLMNSFKYKEAILTPSTFSKDSIINSGYNGNVHVIPHIVEPKTIVQRNKDDDKFRFLYVGEFTTRKGIDVLLKAFSFAFSKDDNVELLLKTYILDGYAHTPKDIMSRIKNYIDVNNTAPIKIFTGFLVDDKMTDLYNSVDVFVTATRGEGFGLPIAEAMSCGKIVIVPDKGGHMEYCNDNNSILFNCVKRPIPDSMLEKGREVYKGLSWFNTDFYDLGMKMKEVYKDIESYYPIGKNAIQTVDTKLSQKVILPKMERIFNGK